MAIQTSTGVRLSISSGIPASYDLAGYGALNYIDIGDVTNIPQFGAAYQTVTNSPLASGVVQKRKGFVDYGNPVVDMAMNDSSSGQQMMRAACTGIRKNQAHAFKMTYGDGSLRYWSARVFSFQELPGSSNQMVGATSSLGITRAILQVPRITLDLAFSDDVYSLNGEVKNFSDIITFNRSTTGTYINQSGVLTTAAIDEPRLSYDPATGESLGLLIEGSSTNLLRDSELFSSGAWTWSAGVVITNSYSTGPDGVAGSASRVQFPSDGRLLGQVVSTPDGVYTSSIYVKGSAGETIRIISAGGAAENKLLTGVWDRLELSGSGSINSFNISTEGGATARDIQVFGAQLEQKPYATSYIKTEASQVTRAADLASVDDLSAWYNQSEGSVFVDAKSLSSDSEPKYACGFDSFSSLSIYEEGSLAVATARGVGNVNVALSDKKASAYNGSSYSVASGGLYDGGGVSLNMSEVTKMNIGNRSNDYHLSGHIKALTYYPSALTESEQKLITL